jgi:Ala-tRNA(Pro) deacylase
MTDKITAAFADLAVPLALTEHAAVLTADEHTAAVAGVAGVGVKNLLIKSKKKQLYCVVALSDRAVNLKYLQGVLGGGGFRFSPAETLKSVLDVDPGCVTPLAAINDAKDEVIFVFDKALENAAAIHVHPLVNTATVTLSWSDLSKFMVRLAANACTL